MNVTYIPWNEYGLCGAACAHMVLHAQKLFGTSQNDQDNIWKSIKDHTNAKNPSLQCTGPAPPSFDNMVREACSGSRVHCWFTHPNALKASLKTLLMGSGATITLRKTANENTANGKIRSCLNRGGIPIVLISPLHWVVVDGWDDRSDQPVSFLDPQLGPTMVDLDVWNSVHMSTVDCGTLINKYVHVEVEP